MQENISQFESRKKDHLLYSLDQSTQAVGQSDFDSIHLVHEGIVDINFNDVQLDSIAFGKKVKKPFYISAMTAGHADANSLNQVFAEAAEIQGWSLGLGSQRRELFASEIKNQSKVDLWDEIKKIAPNTSLYSNIGAAQFIELSETNQLGLLAKLVCKSHGHALAIHFNSLQEVLQPEGTPIFSGIWKAFHSLSQMFKENSLSQYNQTSSIKLSNNIFPIIIKETGCGFSKSTLQKISQLVPHFPNGIVVDVSGKGGTHWGRMEGERARQIGKEGNSLNSENQKLALEANQKWQASQTFANWGESTINTLLAAQGIGLEVWASGGVRSGLDAAKAIALGASQVGFAQPALKAIAPFFYESNSQGELLAKYCNQRELAVDSLINWMKQVEFELQIALFCSGCLTIRQFQTKEGVWKQRQMHRDI